MNLSEIRRLFVDISGRFDLVGDNYVNPSEGLGANFFIQSGQDWLDRMQTTPETPALYEGTLGAGEFVFKFDRAKAVVDIYVHKGDNHYALHKVSYGWLRREYEKKIADVDQGDPYYWANNVLRSADNPTRANRGVDSVIVAPPASAAWDVEIYGHFYSNKLTQDEDVSYWSEEHPMVLVWAAMFQIEVLNRNREGMRDWLEPISQELTNLDHQLVEQEMQQIDGFQQYFPEVNR